MKKLLLSLAVVAMIATVSCGGGADKAAQAKLDSLKKDSIYKDSVQKAEAAAQAADTTKKDTTAVK